MYIVKADYKTRINADLLERILSDAQATPAQILEAISKVAEDTVSSYAGVLYDIAPELLKTATARNHLVMTWALNIATYEMYQRIDDEQVPEKVIKNYDDTVDDLQKLSMGKFPLNLPPKPKESTGTGSGEGGPEDTLTDGAGLLRMGSQKKRSHMP